MGFNCGIIGLPNVGKSTIFNALSRAGAQTANYPFCTIDPNKGIVTVPDDKLYQIADILQKRDPIPTKIEFIDVAGLVKGASKGEGLGNRFLGHIRNVEAIIHVVRCFNSQDVSHVSGDIDPLRDIEIINTELSLADIEVMERARDKIMKLARSGDKASKTKAELLSKLIDHLNNGELLRTYNLTNDEMREIREYGLITVKPVLYLANVDEDNISGELTEEIKKYSEKSGSQFLAITGKLEEEITELSEEEKQEYLEALGLSLAGLDRLIKSAYQLLNLITYYTAATDLQAWTIKEGTTASRAAGKIHTDFEKGFIRADVYNFADLIKTESEQQIKESGQMRSEGKDYIIKEGDIVRYHHKI